MSGISQARRARGMEPHRNGGEGEGGGAHRIKSWEGQVIAPG